MKKWNKPCFYSFQSDQINTGTICVGTEQAGGAKLAFSTSSSQSLKNSTGACMPFVMTQTCDGNGVIKINGNTCTGSVCS